MDNLNKAKTYQQLERCYNHWSSVCVKCVCMNVVELAQSNGTYIPYDPSTFVPTNPNHFNRLTAIYTQSAIFYVFCVL